MKKSILIVVFNLIFTPLLVTSQLHAEEMAAGLGLGLFHIPEEKDFEKGSMPLELFFDMDVDDRWFKFRLGFNSSKAKTSYTALGKDWEHELSTNSFYGAWRYTNKFMPDMDSFATAGLAFIISELSTNNNVKSVSASGLGLVFAAGTFYNLGEINVGGQLQILSGTQDFEGVTLSIGSSQIQGLVTYNF